MKKKNLFFFVFSAIILLTVSLYSFKNTNFPHRVSKLLHKIANYLDPKSLDSNAQQLLSEKKQLLSEKKQLLSEKKQLLSERKQLLNERKQLLNERKYMILRDLGLSFENNHDVYCITRELRDKIYQNNWKSKKFNNLTLSDYVRYNYIFANKSAFTCGKLSAVYQWALDTFDIPSRVVQLAAQSFLDGKGEKDTHVVVEIFDGVKWFVSDSLFNAEYYCSDGTGPLSTKEMRNCISKRNKLIPKYGKTIVPGRTVETYYIPIEALLYAYALYPTVIKDKTIPAEEHPFPDWITASTRKYSVSNK